MSQGMNRQRFWAEQDDAMNISYPEKLKQVLPLEAGLKTTFTVVLMSVALLGNVSVIVTVARNRRMRTATNYFIVNLAVSDLMVSLSCTWVSLVDDLTEGWVLGAFFCVFNSFAQGQNDVLSPLVSFCIALSSFVSFSLALSCSVSSGLLRL